MSSLSKSESKKITSGLNGNGNGKKRYLGRAIWGPAAWHMLHAFSIGGGGPEKPIRADEKKCYYLFYKSFAELIPCAVCKTHYIEYFYHIYTIEEREITRESMKRYIYDLHNIVNDDLGKPKITFRKAMEFHKRTRHSEIFFFMNHAIRQYLKLDLSLEQFDRFYTFFICFCKIYPDKFWRRDLTKLIESPSFKAIKTPSQFLNWYQSKFVTGK
jgi:Erv1 / Alr family